MTHKRGFRFYFRIVFKNLYECSEFGISGIFHNAFPINSKYESAGLFHEMKLITLIMLVRRGLKKRGIRGVSQGKFV